MSLPSSRRISITHRSAGNCVERCTSSGVPSLRVACSAAFNVPLVFTTSTSPARTKSGSLTKGRMHYPVATLVRHHESNLIPVQTAGFRWLARLELDGKGVNLAKSALHPCHSQSLRSSTDCKAVSESSRASFRMSRLQAMDGVSVATSTSRAAYRPLDRSRSNSRSSPGTLVSGSGRSLISSPGNASWCICRPHVPRVHPIHSQFRMFCSQDVRELFERRLGRTISTPSRIRLYGGVAGDIDDGMLRS